MLLFFENEARMAQRIAQAAGQPCSQVHCHQFPDGEIRLQLPADLPAQVTILRTLNRPNAKLVELLLAAQTARTLGARHLTLVAPYLAYMRQDIAFHAGEAISQRVIGDFLATLFDAIVTVDPHLHRVASLREAVPVANAITLSGAPALSDWIVSRRKQPVLLGPDEESAQWVACAAARHELEHAVCHKVRQGDRAVDVKLPKTEFSDREVVLLDDVASTGTTVAQAARLLLAAGASRVDVAVTHALLDDHAMLALHQAGVGEVWSTDCIEHPSNAVSMAPAIADAIRSLQANLHGK